MNTSQHNPQTPFDDTPPPDVRELAAMLDALGAAERDSCPAGLVARIGDGAIAACARLHDEATEGAVHAGELADAELASAPAGLEQRVFDASRGQLTTALRLTGEGRVPVRTVVARGWWSTRAARVAAGLVLAGAAVTVVLVARSQNSPEGPDAGVVAAAFETEMETFFDLLEASPTAETTDRGVDADHNWADSALEWESL